MPFASVAEVKDGLSRYLARARRTRQPIIVTRHGKPYALIQPISERDADDLMWAGLAQRRLTQVWDDEDDALYDYL